MDSQPFSIWRVEDLSDAECISLHQKITSLNPRERQVRDSFTIGLSRYDPSYDKRYEAYIKRIPDYIRSYARHLETLFNQARFRITIRNTGKVQAENLLLDVSTTTGWLHDRYAFVSARGPSAPTLRDGFHMPYLGPLMSPRVGRHETDYKESPNCSPSFSVTCEDFRHGQEWVFEGVIGLDARATDPGTIMASATASNYRGKAEKSLAVATSVTNCHASELVDLDVLTLKVDVPMKHVLGKDDPSEFIDWKAFGNDDDD